MIGVFPFFPLCMVMEPMDYSLYDLLKNGVEFPLAQRLQIALDIADGLQGIHSKKLVHRDIKSLNILIKNLRAKIGDFGSASTECKEGQVIGSYPWMAPESLRGCATSKSDIFSFGMVLFELITKTVPYGDKSAEQIIHYLNKGERPSIPSDAPEKFVKPMQRCWSENPSERPSAKQLAWYFYGLVNPDFLLSDEDKLSAQTSTLLSSEPSLPKPEPETESTPLLKSPQHIADNRFSFLNKASPQQSATPVCQWKYCIIS